jgi:RHS repeat-associated protein
VGTSVTSISYDYENRVVGITFPSSATNSFAYNGDDMRMQKVDSAGTANYLCDGTTPASAVLKDSSAVYTPGLSERRGTTSKFYHSDALGSTRGITNSSQTVTDASLFDGFGNTVSRTGTTPTPFGFVGKGQYQTDSDSGLMLLGHRYYDASVGRFISSDPAKAGNNWFAYCDNNPITRIDPNGEWLIFVIIALIAIDLLVHSEQSAGEHPPGYQLPRQDRPPWLTPRLGPMAPGPAMAMTALEVAVDGPEPGSGMGGSAIGAVGTPSNPPGTPISNSPGFIAPPNGPAIGIPPGYTGRVADNGKGTVWQQPGATGNSGAIRVADPSPLYPGGYSRTYNQGGQPIDPSTGRPGPNSATHTPIEWAPVEEE